MMILIVVDSIGSNRCNNRKHIPLLLMKLIAANPQRAAVSVERHCPLRVTGGAGSQGCQEDS